MKALFAIVVLVILSAAAMAHDAIPTAAKPSGWAYPSSCCSGVDCREIPAKSVKLTKKKNGYVVPNGDEILFADTRIKISPDGLYHWCTVQGLETGRTICLFVPPPSF